jgi:hypothetical protein
MCVEGGREIDDEQQCARKEKLLVSQVRVRLAVHSVQKQLHHIRVAFQRGQLEPRGAALVLSVHWQFCLMSLFFTGRHFSRLPRGATSKPGHVKTQHKGES